MKIKLFTFWYPFGNGEQFLHDEVAYLCDQGVDLTIIPFEVMGEVRDLPDGIKVDKSMAQALSKQSELNVYPLIWSLIAIIRALSQHKVRSFSALRDVIGFAHHGRIVRNWASQNIQKEEILYTYWFERITYGLADYLTRSRNPNILVTRTHGYDLYEERRKHGFIPFREKTLKRLNQVFTISDDGSRYLLERYNCKDQIQRSFLGIKDHGQSKGRPNDVIRIVSCSSIIPLKRVDLICRVIRSYSEQNTSKDVHWYHFGGGESAQLAEEISQIPANCEVHLEGEVPNTELLSFYQRNYIHFFLNLSTTEGLPVSMMEAISFGVPILALDVGGVSEIVNNNTGKLLRPNFGFAEVNAAIDFLVDNENLRKSARNYFEENFIAEKNYHSFYSQLKKLKA